MLGDIPAINLPEEVSSSVFSMDYYRQKATEFQTVMNALDQSYSAVLAAVYSGALDYDSATELHQSLDEFDARRSIVRAAAEAINAAAYVINSSGGRFPVLSLPGHLGLPPLAIPAAIVAGFAAAAGVIAWATGWINANNERLRRAQLLDYATPEQRAQLIAAMSASDASVAAANESPLSSIAGMVKWGAIGLAAWLAWRAYSQQKKG